MTTPFRGRRTYIAVAVSFLCLALADAATGTDSPAPPGSTSQPDEAAQWKELEERLAAFYELGPDAVTGDGLDAFYKTYFPQAGALADEFEAFLKVHPASPHADDAWQSWLDMLNVAAFRMPERKQQLERVESELLADPSLDRERRMTIRRNQLDRTATVAEREHMLRSLESEFSKTDYLYELLAIAKCSDHPHALELVDELLKISEGVSGTIGRDVAALNRLLSRIGKPLELKFTALDGRTVNLEDCRGKVVLLQFWATWCPPCVVGVSKVDKVWKEHRGEGFEVIGLSYDDERATLEEFLNKNAVEWPQFFDHRGWDAPLIQSFGRPGPPAYWLIDRDGVLIDVNAGNDLAARVKKLLAAPAAGGAISR